MAGPEGGHQRFRSLESQEQAGVSTPPPPPDVVVEDLSEVEREALGPLAQPLEEQRRAEPPALGLGPWRDVMRAVQREMAREDLTIEEKKQRVHDIYSAQRGRRSRLLLAAAIGVAAAAALLGILL